MTIGSSVLTSADINGGTIDGTTIGGTTPAVGTFSQVNVNGNVVSDGADLDGAVVINESGADVDLRVESDTNTHALFVQGSDGAVGIGESTPLGNLHIKDGSGSGASPSPTIDDLVVDCSSFGGITILTPNTAAGYLAFGDPDDADHGQIFYAHSTDTMNFRTASGLRATIGLGLYMDGATGGDKGAGTINATAVYDDNTLLTDFVLDQAVDGEIDFDFYDSLELGGKAAREWDSRNLDIDHYEAQWRERKALPSFRSKAERFDSDGQEIRDSVGTLIQGLQQELETAMVHIAQLNARIKQLEEK